MFYENLHKTVREHLHWVNIIHKQQGAHVIVISGYDLIKTNNNRFYSREVKDIELTKREADNYCDMLKQQLLEVLTTYDKCLKYSVGKKRK